MKSIQNSDFHINLKNGRKLELHELIYFAAFSLLLISAMLNTTMFRVYIGGQVKTMIKAFASLMLLFKIFILDKNSKKKLAIISVIELVMFLVWRISGYGIVLDLSLLIIAAKNISFKDIVKIYFYIVLTITILAMIAAQLGLIEHIVYYREGKYRYAFGSIYCTDFASHIFYLVTAFCYLKDGKMRCFHLLAFVLLGLFTYRYCDARVDSICIWGITVLFTFINLKNMLIKDRVLNSKIIVIKKVLLTISVPAIAVVSLVATFFYDKANNMMNELNTLFNNRLMYGKIGMNNYGFKLFGQKVQMQGNGANKQGVTDYFFIDNSFVNIALCYGVIIIITVCIYYAVMNYKLLSEGNYLVPILVLFIAVNSIIAHHFLDIAYNPFLVGLFANTKLKSKNLI